MVNEAESAVTLPLALVAAVHLAGCGYTLGVSMGSGGAAGETTIAVPTFGNDAFPLRRDLEYELTSAVRREIQARSPLTLVEDGSSDVTVYGSIVDYEENVLAEDPQDRKLESVVTLVVRLIVEDYRTKERREALVTESEPRSVTQGERAEATERRALDGLARKIVDHVQRLSAAVPAEEP